MLRTVAAVGLAALSVACAATQPVRVLAKGQSRWIASVGGPLLPHHTPGGIIPYTNVGRMWGHSDDVTLSANVHLLPAAFGVGGVDIGVARRLRRAEGRVGELTGQAQLYAFAGAGGVRVYPNFTGTASWSLSDPANFLLYGGSAMTLRLDGGQAAVVTPHLGVQRDFGRRLVLQLEGKWMAANVDMHSGLFEGENSVGGNGGLAMQFGVQVKR